jgi:hypothetical protein
MTSRAVIQAGHRAKISAFLKNAPGKHKVSEIAQHLGVNGRSAGQLLAKMANNGLLPQPERMGGEWAYEWQESHEPSAVKRPQRHRTPAMGDEMTIEILGAVAVYKRGYISEEQMIAAITGIVKGRNK